MTDREHVTPDVVTRQTGLAYVTLDDLAPDPRNVKRHSLDEIRASIERHGFVEPLVYDRRTGQIVGGHGRVDALHAMRADGAKPPTGLRRGWAVPVMVVETRSDVEAAALLVGLNQLTIVGGWDPAGLAELLQSVAAADPEAGLVGTGFTSESLDALVASLAPAVEDPYKPADDVPAGEADVGPVVSVRGDVWELTSPDSGIVHRVMCGDCREPVDVGQLVGDRRVNLAFTSPPYAEQRDYDPSSGFRPIQPDEFVDWFEPVAANVAGVLADDGSWFVNIKPPAAELDTHLYVFDLVAAHVRKWGWHFLTEFCWERIGIPSRVHRRFKNQFEPIYHFCKNEPKFRPDDVKHPSDAVPINGTKPGDPLYGSYRSGGRWQGKKIRENGGQRGPMIDVQGLTTEQTGVSARPGDFIIEGLAYPGNRLPPFQSEALGHAAAFPVGLPQFFVRAYTDRGDTVYDPFGGSGSTLMASEMEGRPSLLMELSPRYVDMILRRWQRRTGVRPVRAGEAHDFLPTLT